MNSNKQHVLCHSNFPQFLTQIFFWTFWIWFRHKCIDFFDLSQHLELKWIQHFLSYIYSKGIHMSLYVSLYCVLYYVLISWIDPVCYLGVHPAWLSSLWKHTERDTVTHRSTICFMFFTCNLYHSYCMTLLKNKIELTYTAHMVFTCHISTKALG